MITDARFVDKRGYFQELFHEDKHPNFVMPNGISQGISQVSLSFSKRGVLRGIHCSKYTKLITVVKGEIYDVIVDLRVDSPSFRRWCAVIVSSQNCRQIHVPAGCGHGFLCLKDAHMLYLQGGCFDSRNELDISPFDPVLDVHWPKLADLSEYLLSAKDMGAPNLLALGIFRGSCGGISNEVKPLRRILIIGASGQVGGALVEAFGAENVIGTCNKAQCTGMVHFDLQAAANDQQLAEDLMTMCHPEIVVICAESKTWDDGCGNLSEIPMLVNCEGPRNVARMAHRCGAKTVFFSTAFVFDGAKEEKFYTEEDIANPTNVYGATKLAGEMAVLEEDPSGLVLRTAGVFGPEKQGKNFVFQICKELSAGREIQCASDLYSNPTYSRDLAKVTLGLLDVDAKGIFHCVGPETLDLHTFAILVAETLSLDSSKITTIDSRTLDQNTKMPLGVVASHGKQLRMSTDKIKALLPEEFNPTPITKALLHWKANPMGVDFLGS